MPKKILILGGTSEAYELAKRLILHYSPEQLSVITSLAGSTGTPKIPAGKIRVGGFNGTSGLCQYLEQEQISLLVDATHPYAGQITKNALSATTERGLPYLRLTRVPWTKQAGDRWIEVPDLRAAANFLNYDIELQSGLSQQTVFLTTGKRDLSFFRECRNIRGDANYRFVVRTAEPPELDVAWPEAVFLRDRGPFTLENELALFRRYSVTLLVTKNSGGDSTYAKIEAARKLEIPALTVARPEGILSEACYSLDDALNRIAQEAAL